MIKAVWLLTFCMLIVAAYGLTGKGDSDYFAMDTVAPELSLISPNGGEVWYIGDTNNILWTASDTNLSPNSIYLWYSLSGGSDYQSLAEGLANSGSYPWELPSAQSYNARVRIRVNDSFGNFTQKSSLGAFSITYVPPAPPQGVVIDTSNNLDAVLSWQPVTSTINNTPIVPDGYIVLYNETPYEDEQFYYYHGETTGTTYTHYNVARRRTQMFYKIVAFKDYDARIANVLRDLDQDSSQPRLWKDILRDLYSAGGDK